MTNYQSAEIILKETADMAKSQFTGDKPAIRQIINDSADDLGRKYDFNEHQKNNLALYACKLHPKN